MDDAERVHVPQRREQRAHVRRQLRRVHLTHVLLHTQNYIFNCISCTVSKSVLVYSKYTIKYLGKVTILVIEYSPGRQRHNELNLCTILKSQITKQDANKSHKTF